MVQNKLHKLGIGTVQFGLDYGVSNASGQTPLAEAHSILKNAKDIGVDVIDTAHLYGNSEDVIGAFDDDFQIVTKTVQFQKDKIETSDVDDLKRGIEKSLSRLNRSAVYGLLFHSCDDVMCENGGVLYRALQEQKEQGVTSKIGASIYTQDHVDFLLDNFDVDLVQVPLNVFDQRLIRSGALQRLKKCGVEIHVRSAFLQGLIFMNAENLPEKIKHATPLLMDFCRICHDLNVSPIEAALSFVLNLGEVDKVICGVNSLEQFKEISDVVSSCPNLENAVFDCVATQDDSIVNPAKWN